MAVEKIVGTWSPENIVLAQLVDLVQHGAQTALASKGIVAWLNQALVTDPKWGVLLKNYDLTSQAVDAAVMGLGHALKDEDIKGIGSYASLFRLLNLVRSGALMPLLLPHSPPLISSGANPISPNQGNKAPSPRGLEALPAIY